MSTATQMNLLDPAVNGEGDGCAVFVVDDYPWIGELIAMGLNGLGCHTSIATNGEEAREEILRRGSAHVDLLIVELEIPGLEGKALAEWFLHENPKGQVILMSSFPFAVRPLHRMAFLRKPFDHDELLTKVNERLAASRRCGTPVSS